MKLVKVHNSNNPLLAGVPALYESSFPDDERTDTAQFLSMIDDCPQMTFNAIVDEDELAGMAVIWDLGICRYLLYLAVVPDKRNNGLGAQTLKLLQEESELPILGEVERPINEMNVRRIEFYKRNGFHIETENPAILNAAHSHASCILQLISTRPLSDIDECQRRIVDIVYKSMHSPKMIALVIGATGATGRDLVSQLLEDSKFSDVHIFVRHDVSFKHDKLHVHIVDFDRLDDWKCSLQGDVLFSALGTTLKQAGSQKAQWKIDYTYQYEVAKAARYNGVESMVLVSSAWASADSKVFYTRMKGQLEADVKNLGFKSLSIMRPPSLIRRGTDRLGERISVGLLQGLNRFGILKSIRPMPTSQVAHAMICMAKQSQEGISILEPKDIWAIA